MFDKILSRVQNVKDRVENIVKIGTVTKTVGADAQLQDIQIKTLRNLEDALKIGQFGFNSKAPNESRAVVLKIGNTNVIVALEHIASIIDIKDGDTVMYNATGTKIELEGANIRAALTKLIISNGTDEVVDILSQILAQLKSLSSTLATDAVAVTGNGAPLGGLATYQNIAAQLPALISKFDAFKE